MVKNAKPVRRKAKMTWRKIPTQGVILIQGHRGEGKSALGWWLAQEMHKLRPNMRSQVGVNTTLTLKYSLTFFVFFFSKMLIICFVVLNLIISYKL